MEPRVNRIPLSYEAAVAFLAGRATKRVPGIRATVVRVLPDERIGVAYRDTDVVTFLPTGQLLISGGGYRQRTTKSRINAVLTARGYRLRQIKGEWRLLHGDTNVPFEDEMLVAAAPVSESPATNTLDAAWEVASLDALAALPPEVAPVAPCESPWTPLLGSPGVCKSPLMETPAAATLPLGQIQVA
jgi:hypothetical protein